MYNTVSLQMYTYNTQVRGVEETCTLRAEPTNLLVRTSLGSIPFCTANLRLDLNEIKLNGTVNSGSACVVHPVVQSLGAPQRVRVIELEQVHALPRIHVAPRIHLLLAVPSVHGHDDG